MKVLIACEFSGVVRRAFRERGHDAWSCDLLPAAEFWEGGKYPYHYQDDIRRVLQFGPKNWDLMIAHPPCTYLCNSGVRWLYKDEPVYAGVLGRTSRYHRRVKDEDRWGKMNKGCDLFAALWNAPIARVAIENPVMHRHAREYLNTLGVPAFTQSIQPWQFGHGETKRTCLWLRGLQLLQATHRKGDLFCEPEPIGREARIHRLPPSEDRAKLRSITYAGIAKAMAEQWG